MRSLSVKLAAALLLIVVVSLGLMVVLTRLTTAREFNSYFMGGRGGMMGGMIGGILDAAQQDFLNRVTGSLWIAGLIAAAAALVIGLVLTRQITKPVRALTTGAQKVAKGEVSYRVKVESKDELGTLAQAFNEMAASLDKGEMTRKRLIADITHELRTPLTVIEGTTDGILDGVFPPDKEHLGTIKEQTALLTRLIGELRDLSLAESGQLKLERTSTDMAELLKHKMSELEAQAAEKNIRLQLNAEAAPTVNVDATRIGQAITNLMSNAIRHTNGGNVTVSLRNGEGNGIMVAVADTGEGIAAEHLPHIFDRFYRVSDARSRNDGGSGLGLAIVKQMIEAHGGRVWAESQPGKGSTFYFSLPASNHKPAN